MIAAVLALLGAMLVTMVTGLVLFILHVVAPERHYSKSLKKGSRP